ncbi:MAG: hypothetical protein PHV80_07495 [Rugosibacter sp.]|nr:hypothetical protein [Rugosibacter sp.]
MPGQRSRAAGQPAASPVRGGEAGIRAAAGGWLCKADRVSPRGWAGAGLYTVFRVFYHQ